MPRAKSTQKKTMPMMEAPVKSAKRAKKSTGNAATAGKRTTKTAANRAKPAAKKTARRRSTAKPAQKTRSKSRTSTGAFSGAMTMLSKLSPF